MHVKKHSFFKDPEADGRTFRQWVGKLEHENGYTYQKRTLQTSLGDTQVYGFHTEDDQRETLVIFPGFRTTTLIWDLDQGLQSLAKRFRLYLVETNGQPNLSAGHTPSVKSLGYGEWGAEVFKQLNLESAYVAGASFGGLVCMKIALVIPQKIKAAFLLNPGCFRMVSMAPRNLYYNLLPMVKTTEANIKKFLDRVVFCKPNHALSATGEGLLVEYLNFALQRYQDNTEKPYYMGDQLNRINVPTHLLVGDRDILIPYQKSVARARKHLGESLLHVEVFKDVAHGIECHPAALAYIKKAIERYQQEYI